jgi:hypothetical protein
MNNLHPTMEELPMSHSQFSHHHGAISRPAPDFIDLVGDSSDSDDDCIMLGSAPSPFQRRDGPQDGYQDEHKDEPQREPPSADLPYPNPRTPKLNLRPSPAKKKGKK